jgi:hypothetical protein
VKNILIDDPDLNPSIFLDLTSGVGSIGLSGDVVSSMTSIKLVEGIPSGDKSLQFVGTVDHVNMLLKNLAYLPLPASKGSIDFIKVVVTVIDDLGQNTSRSNEEHIQVFIFNALNDPPVIRYSKSLYLDEESCESSYHPPSSQRENAFCNEDTIIEPIHCVEDRYCTMEGISVNDIDSMVVQLSMQVTHGFLIPNMTATDIEVLEGSEDRSRRATFRGSGTNINAALGSGLVKYMSKRNFIGKDLLKLSVRDESLRPQPFAGDSLDIQIVVSRVTDKIFLSGPLHLHDVEEDSFLAINSITIQYDEYHSQNDLRFVQVRLAALDGQIRLGSENNIHFLTPSVAEDALRLWDNAKKVDGLSSRTASNTGDKTKFNRTMLSGATQKEWWVDATICGRLVDINNALGKITFIPKENWNSQDYGDTQVQLKVKSVVECMDSSDSLRMTDVYESSFNVLVYVLPMNDPPSITVDAFSKYRFESNLGSNLQLLPKEEDSKIYVEEDTDVLFNITLSDIDDIILTVEIASNGFGSFSLPYKGLSNLQFIDGDADGKPHNKFKMTGSIDSLNSQLDLLVFRGNVHYNGADCIVICKVWDDEGLVAADRTLIEILPVKDALQLWMTVDGTLSSPLLVLDEGDNILVGATWFETEIYMETRMLTSSFNPNKIETRKVQGRRAYSLDSEDTNSSSSKACIQLQVNLGCVQINPIPIFHVTFENGISKGSSIRMCATIEALNDIAERVHYHAREGESGEANLKISLFESKCHMKYGNTNSFPNCFSDFESPLVAATIGIHVTSRNNPPLIKWDGNESMAIMAHLDTPIFIPSISIHDIDLTAHQEKGYLSLVISVTRGSLQLSSLHGLSFSLGNGVDGDSFHFSGEITDVNAALTNIKYICTSLVHKCNIHSKEIMFVLADDNGFTGRGGALSSEATFNITFLS